MYGADRRHGHLQRERLHAGLRDRNHALRLRLRDDDERREQLRRLRHQVRRTNRRSDLLQRPASASRRARRGTTLCGSGVRDHRQATSTTAAPAAPSAPRRRAARSPALRASASLTCGTGGTLCGSACVTTAARREQLRRLRRHGAPGGSTCAGGVLHCGRLHDDQRADRQLRGRQQPAEPARGAQRRRLHLRRHHGLDDRAGGGQHLRPRDARATGARRTPRTSTGSCRARPQSGPGWGWTSSAPKGLYNASKYTGISFFAKKGYVHGQRRGAGEDPRSQHGRDGRRLHAMLERLRRRPDADDHLDEVHDPLRQHDPAGRMGRSASGQDRYPPASWRFSSR